MINKMPKKIRKDLSGYKGIIKRPYFLVIFCISMKKFYYLFESRPGTKSNEKILYFKIHFTGKKLVVLKSL